MAEEKSYHLLEDGSRMILEDGTGFHLLEEVELFGRWEDRTGVTGVWSDRSSVTGDWDDRLPVPGGPL